MNFETDQAEFKRVEKFLRAAIKAGLKDIETGQWFVGTDAMSFARALTGAQLPYMSAQNFGVLIHQLLSDPELLKQHKAAAKQINSRKTPIAAKSSEPIKTKSDGTPDDLYVESEK